MTVLDKLSNEYGSKHTREWKKNFSEDIANNDKFSIYDLSIISNFIDSPEAK